MGNQLAQPQKLQPEHLAELPNVVLKDTLGWSSASSGTTKAGLADYSIVTACLAYRWWQISENSTLRA